jgi:hypothetical protein
MGDKQSPPPTPRRVPRFTISLKRSTQNLQLSTSWPADYPIYRGIADIEQAGPIKLDL